MGTNKKPGKWRKRTLAVRGGQMRTPFQETCEALYPHRPAMPMRPPKKRRHASRARARATYSRLAIPTVSMFEDRLAQLEGAPVARATATGMAAVTATFLRPQDRRSCGVRQALFGACRYVIETVLPRFGIASTFVDGSDSRTGQAAMRPETKCCSSKRRPIRPCDRRHRRRWPGSRTRPARAWSWTMPSPARRCSGRWNSAPHIVVHSSTKYIDGQGRALGGVILCSEDFLKENLQKFLRNTGPAMSPFNAWLHLKSLETLDLRMQRIARMRRRSPTSWPGTRKSTRVLYPFRPDHPQHNLARAQMAGGGGVVSFEIAGGKSAAFRCANALQLIDISNNLGDTKSLFTHPETTTHQRLTPEARAAGGVTAGLCACRWGWKITDDLCEDLDQALKVA